MTVDPPNSRLADRMTDSETLMWNVEKDPSLSSTIGSLLVLDRPVDHERLYAKVREAVVAIPRLRERVFPQPMRTGTPLWRTDTAFELGYHVRHLALPAPGRPGALLELVTRLLQDPFDRTRPLWQFFAIDGLAGGGGALLVKLHHTITDGQGGVKLAERYLDFSADAVPVAVDLEAVLAEAAAADSAAARTPSDPATLGQASLHGVAGLVTQNLDVGRKLAAEALLTLADPQRIGEAVSGLGGTLRSAADQLAPGDETEHSPLWQARSRRRKLVVMSLPQGAAKTAATALGGTLNDFFVAGAVAGAGRYHDVCGCPVDALTVSFIVSTRGGDRSEGGNAFTPSKAVLPAGPIDAKVRFDAVREALGARRKEVAGAGLLASLSGMANLLPTSVTTRLAMAQARGVDFATSNVRAAPVDVFAAGSRVLATYPIGPVAGTAFNVTLMSYSGRLDLGINIDPDAVEDPELLVECLQRGYDELHEAAGVPVPDRIAPFGDEVA